MTIKFLVDENRPFYGKFWPGEGVPHQLDYDYSWTLNDLLEDAVKKFPNDPAIWLCHIILWINKNWCNSIRDQSNLQTGGNISPD